MEISWDDFLHKSAFGWRGGEEFLLSHWGGLLLSSNAWLPDVNQTKDVGQYWRTTKLGSLTMVEDFRMLRNQYLLYRHAVFWWGLAWSSYMSASMHACILLSPKAFACTPLKWNTERKVKRITKFSPKPEKKINSRTNWKMTISKKFCVKCGQFLAKKKKVNTCIKNTSNPWCKSMGNWQFYFLC